VLNAALRMLHPICPFVTEALWPHVTAAGEPGLDGIELPPSELLAVATWPDIACKVDDTEAAASFERARALTELIRSVRGEKSIPNKARLSLLVTPPVQPLIDAADGLVQTIAGLDRISVTSEHPKDAIPLTFEGEHLFLTGLSGAVDRTQERLRLQKVVQDLQKSVAGFRNKLHNEDYVRKAPAAVVEETRQRYARAEAELAAAAQALEALGG
jgi:valyl-tRNA synthetase